MKKPLNFKIVLLGNSDVGKSTIFESFFGSIQRNTYVPTMEPLIRKYTVKAVDNDICIRIFDCPGNQGYFDIHGKKILQGTDVAVILYSAIDNESLMALQYWSGQISQYLEVIPVLIVATKIDLLENTLWEKSSALQQGKKIAHVFQRVLKLSELPYLEITAIDPHNAIQVFNKAFSLLGSWISFSDTAFRSPKTTTFPSTQTNFTDVLKITTSNPNSQLETTIVALVSELNQTYNSSPIAQTTVTSIIELLNNEWAIKFALEHLDRQNLTEIFNTVTKDSQWLQKKKFLYLLLFTGLYTQITTFMRPNEDLKTWVSKIAQFFVSTKDSLDHFWNFDKKEQKKLLQIAYSSKMDMIKFKQEIYFHYRSLIYRTKL